MYNIMFPRRKLSGVPNPMSMKPSPPPDNRVVPNIPIPMRGLSSAPRTLSVGKLLSGVKKGIRYM